MSQDKQQLEAVYDAIKNGKLTQAAPIVANLISSRVHDRLEAQKAAMQSSIVPQLEDKEENDEKPVSEEPEDDKTVKAEEDDELKETGIPASRLSRFVEIDDA